LGIAFSGIAQPPSFVRESPVGGCQHGELDEGKVLAAVMAGIEEVSTELHPAEIVYVANDSPRYDLYRHCARLLAEQYVSGVR
jgi:hypothetical protein